MDDIDEVRCTPASDASAQAVVEFQSTFKGLDGKMFNDPLHHHFALSSTARKFFDVRQFQRLRELKQLGLTYMVFPGASHNRFEHSLGTAHLAKELALRLSVDDRTLEVEDADYTALELAGLCHDLGHGPFSHVFEKAFIPKACARSGICNMHWSHEDMSIKMLDAILDENVHNIMDDELTPEDVKRVKDMIMAGHAQATAGPHGKRWLYEIVANGRNGLDVDKYDYLQRDSKCCGVSLTLDVSRILHTCKEYQSVYDVFKARAHMHQVVYTHKKAKGIELMVVDALLEAEPRLRLLDFIHAAEDFVRLDDSILREVENWGVFGTAALSRTGDDPPIRSAQAIITRLRNRDLYRFVEEVVIPYDRIEADRWRAPREEDIVSCSNGSNAFDVKDVILFEVGIDFTAGPRNPLENVSFFVSRRCTSSFSMSADMVSGIRPMCHQEVKLRCYSRNSTPSVCKAMREAFQAWVKRNLGAHVTCSTPAPQRDPLQGVRATADPSRKRKLNFGPIAEGQ